MGTYLTVYAGPMTLVSPDCRIGDHIVRPGRKPPAPCPSLQRPSLTSQLKHLMSANVLLMSPQERRKRKYLVNSWSFSMIWSLVVAMTLAVSREQHNWVAWFAGTVSDFLQLDLLALCRINEQIEGNLSS